VKRTRNGAVLSLLLCMVAAALPALAKPPREISLSYHVTRGGMPVAVIDERFEAAEQAFRITSESSPVGLFALVQRRPARVISTGRITERGLQPERFEGARGADDPRRVAADFDWPQARLTIKHQGREEIVQLPLGTQDRLSAMYQFMFIDFERLTNLEFAMTNGRKLDHYRYAVTPGVEIDTPLGRLKTVHLAKLHEPGETGTEVWLSPAHSHLPVKMRVVESDGARYEQTITRLEVRL